MQFNFRYLIVDDSTFVRELIKGIADHSGLQFVGETESAINVAALIESYRPHILFVDLVLPGKSGLELIAEIKADSPQVKIIALSTLTDYYIEKKAIDAGANVFVFKPFTKDSLSDAIEKILGEKTTKTAARGGKLG